jgi:hypothetical protein
MRDEISDGKISRGDQAKRLTRARLQQLPLGCRRDVIRFGRVLVLPRCDQDQRD